MRRFSVVLRLLAGFSLLLGLFAAVVVIGVARLNRLSSRVSYLEQQVTPVRGLTTRLVSQARAQTAAVREMQAPYLKGPAVYLLYRETVVQMRIALTEIDRYTDTVPGLPEALMLAESALSAVEQGPMMTRPFPTTMQAQRAMGNEEEPLARALAAATVQADEAAMRWRNAAISDIRTLARTVQRDLVGFAVGASVLGLLFSLLAAHSVTGPVARLLAATQSVAEGNFQVQLADTGRDELGALGRNFDLMTQRLADSRAQLERYTQELAERVEEVERAEANARQYAERLAILTQVVAGWTTKTEMQVLLREIVQTARRLVGARYAALGMVKERTQLAEFIPDGMTDEEIAAIDHWPEGNGLLGAMLKEGKIIRIPDIAADSRRAGFPPGHPPMKSLLGVPIIAEGQPLGHIYLTDKQGAEEFCAEDQRILELLAGGAALAIVNLRLYDDLRRHAIQLESRAQELQALNTELEAFTYSVSHDLRSPLRHMDGFSRLLLEEHSAALSDEARRYLTRIRDATRQMGQLVDDLLNLARVGRQELNRQLTGVNALVEEVATQLKREHADRTIEWKIQSLPFLDCDPALMKQVFANLLSNAVKFTRPRECAVIEVGALTQDAQATIFVRDNGVGFSMKYADKLFGVFQRLHRPEDFEGTGVGLATVQRIIHKHGGRVWAEAEANRGATFYFTLGQRPTQSPEPTR